jgi:uncharacterized LabA/DUF88 family protein
MEYLRIFSPLDQPSGPWRGQSFLGAEHASAPRAPSTPRAHIFIDGQNLFRSAKAAFGYSYPNYDPVALAALVCKRQSLRCAGVHFYTGVHRAGENRLWYDFWNVKLRVLGTRGVDVYSRPLAYAQESILLPDGSRTEVRIAREKGIDVRIALDMVRLAREDAYDVAVLFSQDQDLNEAVSEVHRIRTDTGRWMKVYCAFLVDHAGGHRPWVRGAAPLPITRAEYERCIDPMDYRGAR